MTLNMGASIRGRVQPGLDRKMDLNDGPRGQKVEESFWKLYNDAADLLKRNQSSVPRLRDFFLSRRRETTNAAPVSPFHPSRVGNTADLLTRYVTKRR